MSSPTDLVNYEHEVTRFPQSIKEKLQCQLNDQREIFNHDNCFLIIEHHEKHAEYFIFYTPREKISAVNSYFNQLDDLKKFTRYFRHRAKDIIKECDANRLITPEKSYRVIDNQQTLIRTKPATTIELFTSREKQVCDVILEGLTAKQAADILCVTSKTVEKHIENIKRKLGCKRKAQVMSLLRDMYGHKE